VGSIASIPERLESSMADVTPLGPLITAHLFPTLDAQLIDLLRALTPEDWERQTIAPRWKVKDVAAHLLDTQLRKLSFGRDGCTPPPIASDRDLVSFIDRLNAEGVTVYRRLSPPVLIAWMEQTSREAASYYASLDPLAPAPIGVSWAGESVSANWFDVARELTERWHHQQQIRLAVAEVADAAPDQSANGARSLRAIMTPELYHPVLDCFMRALPFHYRSMSAPLGTAIRISVTGDCGGDWHLYRGDAWLLASEPAGTIAATVTIPQDIAWRIFTKGIARERAREHVRVTGDAALGDHVLNMLAIVG
jgi:uncharacterized protein (TIGR03083 family)